MILSDRDIKKEVEKGRIIIEPKPNWEKQLGSCSLDLRLGGNLEGKNLRFLKSSDEQATSSYLRHGRGQNKPIFSIAPGEFLLGATEEYIELPDDICALLHGRSSLGRRGLMIHSTAPLIDAGFYGRIVLEFFNAGPEPISLKYGVRICAVSFEKLTTPAKIPYHKKKNAKFLGQKKP